MKILWSFLAAVLAQEGAFDSDEAVYIRPAFGPEIRGRPVAKARPTLRPVNKVPGKRPIKKVAKKAPKKIIKKRPVKKVPKKKIPPRPKTTKKTTTTTTTEETTTEETTTVPPTTTESVVEEQREVIALEAFGEEKGWNTFNEYPNNYNNNQVQNADQYSTENAQGYAAGDPHFMVETEGQPPICFDFNPPLDADLNLFSDPETGLVLTGNYLKEKLKYFNF